MSINDGSPQTNAPAIQPLPESLGEHRTYSAPRPTCSSLRSLNKRDLLRQHVRELASDLLVVMALQDNCVLYVNLGIHCIRGMP